MSLGLGEKTIALPGAGLCCHCICSPISCQQLTIVQKRMFIDSLSFSDPPCAHLAAGTVRSVRAGSTPGLRRWFAELTAGLSWHGSFSEPSSASQPHTSADLTPGRSGGTVAGQLRHIFACRLGGLVALDVLEHGTEPYLACSSDSLTPF